MKVGIICPGKDVSTLKSFITKQDNNLEVEIWPDISDYGNLDVAIVWNHPKGLIPKMKNLKFIQSFGAGVDHVLNDPEFSGNLPISRIIDPDLNLGLLKYVLSALWLFEKNLLDDLSVYFIQKNARNTTTPNSIRVGVLGLGQSGSLIAETIAHYGYEVRGMSQSSKSIPGVSTFTNDQLDSFLDGLNALICTLPLTPETIDFISAEILTRLESNSLFINIGRGEQVVEDDLIQAVKNGTIGLAVLDVVKNEPFGPNHPFFGVKNIFVTAHKASLTNIKSVADQVVENINLYSRGKRLIGLIDPKKGY